MKHFAFALVLLFTFSFSTLAGGHYRIRVDDAKTRLCMELLDVTANEPVVLEAWKTGPELTMISGSPINMSKYVLKIAEKMWSERKSLFLYPVSLKTLNKLAESPQEIDPNHIGIVTPERQSSDKIFIENRVIGRATVRFTTREIPAEIAERLKRYSPGDVLEINGDYFDIKKFDTGFEDGHLYQTFYLRQLSAFPTQGVYVIRGAELKISEDGTFKLDGKPCPPPARLGRASFEGGVSGRYSGLPKIEKFFPDAKILSTEPTTYTRMNLVEYQRTADAKPYAPKPTEIDQESIGEIVHVVGENQQFFVRVDGELLQVVPSLIKDLPPTRHFFFKDYDIKAGRQVKLRYNPHSHRVVAAWLL
jgi:hypothetical protein